MADKEQGSGTEGPDADGGGNSQEQGQHRTFTQQELDAIIADRLKRDRSSRQPEYDQLKAKAEKWAEFEESQKTELQKAQEAAAEAKAAKDKALATANERLIQAKFIEAASRLGVKHPEDAYRLANRSDVGIGDDGKVLGVDAAVQALVDGGRLPLSQRPTAPNLDGGAGSGQRAGDGQKPLTEQERAIAAKMGLTPEQYAAAKG